MAGPKCSFQAKLYHAQKCHYFDTSVEKLNAFSRLNIVMGYPVFSAIRDYWVTDPHLRAAVVANIMPLKLKENSEEHCTSMI